MTDRVLDCRGGLGERELVRDEPAQRVLAACDEGDGLGELVALQQLTPSTSISLNARSPTRIGASCARARR